MSAICHVSLRPYSVQSVAVRVTDEVSEVHNAPPHTFLVGLMADDAIVLCEHDLH